MAAMTTDADYWIGVAEDINRAMGNTEYEIRIGDQIITHHRHRPERKPVAASPVEDAYWVVGRRRTGGVMVFYKETSGGRVLQLALVLSEGACDSIERIWADGEEVTFSRSGNRLSGSDAYQGKIEVYEYFDADGTQGAELRSAAGADWSAAHRLHGLSWVYAVLTQPDYGEGEDRRFWTSRPDLEFLMRGIKITWPGQATPTWSENAAALRYWFLRTRRGIPDAAIDHASVRAAVTLCGAQVTADLPEGYEDYDATSARYAVNGVIHAADDPEQVEAELDFAWQGWVVETAGVHHFRPGADRTIARTITPGDIIAIEGIQPAPALQDRINAAAMSLAQSREHDWLEVSLPEFNDTDAQDRDGERLPKDLGARAFVADPIAGGRLLATQIRRARANATFTYRLKSGRDMGWLAVMPSDWVLIDDPEHGLDDFQAMVTRSVINPDWTVTLDLIEQPNGVYADTLHLPALKPRDIDVPGVRTVPVVVGLAADEIAETQADGTILVWLVLTWTSAAPYTEARWRKSGETGWERLDVSGRRARILGVAPGATYEYGVRHLNINRIASQWVSGSRTIGGDLTPPEDVAGLVLTAVPGGYTAAWTAAAAKDYADTEIWEAPSQITDFESATKLAAISGTSWTRLGLGTATEVRVWARHRDRSGNLGGAASAVVTSESPAAGPQGPPGQRARGDFYAARSYSSWSNAVANAATPGDNVISDTVTQYRVATSWVQTRAWNGSSWVTVGRRLDGNLLMPGSVVANAIAANAITASKIAAGAITASKIAAGAITADSVSADVINFRKLTNSQYSVPENGTRTITLSRSMSGYDAIYLVVSEGYISGLSNRVASIMAPLNALTINAAFRWVLSWGTLDVQRLSSTRIRFWGFDGQNTIYIRYILGVTMPSV